MGSPKLLLHRLLVTALAAVLGVGLLTATTAARSEPAGVPVADFRGGALVGWGANNVSQTTIPPSLNGKTVTAIAAGHGTRSLALTSDGEVTAIGPWSQPLPTTLTGKTITAIAVGGSNGMALTSDGEIISWNSAYPVPGPLLSKRVTAIAAGEGHMLALTRDGRVTAWGDNAQEQTAVPPELADKTVTAIAAGTYHSLALTSDGRVTSWGAAGAPVPTSLAGKTVTAIAGGDKYSLALTSDGRLTNWGWNGWGAFDVPDSLSSKTVTAMAASSSHMLALTSDGTLTTWGSTEPDLVLPAKLDGKIVTAFDVGSRYSLAIATDFRAEGKPVISGDPVLGGAPVSAVPSRYTATPDKISYQWYADGAPIIGATASTFQPAGAHLGKRISVQVTAILAGFPDIVTISDPTGPVARPGQTPTGTAPTIKLDTTSTKLRRGQAATLTWSSSAATTVTASGAWTGPQAASGSAQVKPATLGVSTYVLTAINAAGSTTAQVQVTVTRPAAKLKVTAAKGKHRAGTKVKITIRGLETGEKYTIRVGKKKYAGTAKNARPLVRAIPLPKAGGRTTIRVTGDQPDRKGAVKVRVVRR